MRGIVFQDVFSNLFLGIFVLMILALRLSGSPAEPATRVLACELPNGAQAPLWATIFEATGPRANIGEALWAGETEDLPYSLPANSGETFVSVVRGGCAEACYRCTDAPQLSVKNGEIAVAGCEPAQCEKDVR